VAPADPNVFTSVSGPLVLADISGYTSFLQNVTHAHRADAFADGAVLDAYAVISSLLDGIVAGLAPPFTLAKLEGDAVFAYAADPSAVPHGSEVLECLEGCYTDFRKRVGTAKEVWMCWCDACARVDALDLKFILHAGPFVIQNIGDQSELVGPEVVIAHRLLKSRANEVAGQDAFMLVTDAAATMLEVPLDGALPIVETYDHYPPVDARVYPLRAA